MGKNLFIAFTTAALLLTSYTVTAQKTKEDSLYRKSVADAIANYRPKKAIDSNALKAYEELKKAGAVEVEASVNAEQWRHHLEKKLKSPIEKAAKKGMKAGYYTVLINFLVEKDGSVTDVTALNDPGYGLAEASVKVVETGPAWSPGTLDGKPARSYHTQPLTFVISER